MPKSADSSAEKPLAQNRKQRLIDFAEWVKQHVTGDEKGEAQLFLDRLFQAYGHKGVREAGATLEMRIKKQEAGVAFADLVWKPYVLIEMKKRGEDLARHYRQAFDYWTRLVPDRPHYVILCNFDEFWVYDFETQMDTPKDRVSLADLPERNGTLAFLSPVHETPVFSNDQVAVTREAADRLALCFNSLMQRGVKRDDAQAYILQMLVALFSEHVGLLEQYTVTRLLDQCKTPADSYDLIGGLFVAMNNWRGNPGGKYKGVAYFNGGLFASPAQIELNSNEINLLKAAAESNWGKVSPEIFGTLFEHSAGDKVRRAFGQHFTSPADIMKIVGPTIVEPWRERIEGANTRNDLRELLDRIQHFTVLDPACGSGNFLYIAYRELKRLEARIFERMDAEFKSERAIAGRLSFLTAKNFFGMDINPFAVELAKVTMMIARKLAIDELHISEQALPLDNLDSNFKACDALIDEDGLPTTWPATDVIIGNPPFLGAKRLKPERGADYIDSIRKAYPDVPGMADYCVYWFRKAHDQLKACVLGNPVVGRAGLVGTQNVRNNQSRVGGLEYIVKDGTIIEAVENQPWSGEANVHVSIANWCKTQEAALLPKAKRLWFKVADDSKKKKRNKGEGSASKTYQLAFRECPHINSALSDQVDVSGAKTLSCNREPPRVYNGQFPRHKGFVIEPGEAHSMLKANEKNRKVVHPFLIGREMISEGRPGRWVIDFQKQSILEARRFAAPFARIKATVLPHVAEYAEREKKETVKGKGQDQAWLRTWWQHFRCRKELIDLIAKLPRYLACAEVTKRPIFCFVDSNIRPDHTLEVFTLADDYSFGVLQSGAHWLWFVTKCSKLKSDFRYTPESVFDTFPWPQSPTKKQIDAIVAAGREIRRIRAKALKGMSGGLRALYRTLELPGKNELKDAHAALDAAVLDAYGFSAKKDLLGQLLELNLAVAKRIENGDTVTPPGVPESYPDAQRLITEDCVRAEE